MFGLWAVARQTFRQCLRMKIAGLFIIVLAVTLLAVPFVIEGDGTLAGKIRTFLSYSTGWLTTGVLCLVTVFLGASVVSSDVRNKRIFSIATKPISRLQYLLGRWLGVVLFDAVLLSMTAGGIYFLAQYLRAGEPLNDDDRRAVETEVFVARRSVAPDPTDLKALVDARISRLKAEGRYERELQSVAMGDRVDRRQAEENFRHDIYMNITTEIQSVGPNKQMQWVFSDVQTAGSESVGPGRVLALLGDRSSVLLESDPLLVAKLIYGGPVVINGVDAAVSQKANGRFIAKFGADEFIHSSIQSLSPGKQVEITVEPTVQFTFTITPSESPPGAEPELTALWEMGHPDKGFARFVRNDLPKIRRTITVPARLIGDDGKLHVHYRNLPKQLRSGVLFSTSVTILNSDLAVLHTVGGFGWNFVKGFCMIMIMLTFLAALAVMAGSFVSFPVACLISFSMLPFQLAREFISGAIDPRYAGQGLFGKFSNLVMTVMNRLLPDFSKSSPAEAFVEGADIPWSLLGETALWAICVQTVAVLLISWLLFRKRELARVQV